jgi:hypothetical protein
MILTIDDPIYTQSVIVAIDEPSTVAILRAILKAGYRMEGQEEMAELLDMNDSAGRTVQDPDSGAVAIRLSRLRKGNVEDTSNLVHECVHAATMLFDRVGFPLKAGSDEPLAYYVAFLVRSVLSRL